MDLPDAQKRTATVIPYFESRALRIFQVSAVTGRGMKELILEVGRQVEEIKVVQDKTRTSPQP